MIVDSRQADLFLLFSVNEQQTQVCSFNTLTSLAREGTLRELPGNTGKNVKKIPIFASEILAQKKRVKTPDIALTGISPGS